jgi:tetratricopeptide (TPR) repeat protein
MAAASKPHGRKHRGRPVMDEGLAKGGLSKVEIKTLREFRGICGRMLDGGMKPSPELSRKVRISLMFTTNILDERLKLGYEEPEILPKGEAAKMREDEADKLVGWLEVARYLIQAGNRMQGLRTELHQAAHRIIVIVPFEKSGLAHEWAHNYSEAGYYFRNAARQLETVDPPRAALLYERAGKNYHSAGKLDEAECAWTQAVQLDPKRAGSIGERLRDVTNMMEVAHSGKPGEKETLLRIAMDLGTLAEAQPASK